MKTKTKKQTCSASKAHNGQTAADTNKKYEVRLFWSQESEARVIIEAASSAKAEEMAEAIESEDIDVWNPIAGELFVDSVEPVDGGQSND